MTIDELHQAVKVEIDKTSSLELPAFEQEEIDYWIYRAVQRFSEEKVNLYIASNREKVVLSKIQDDIAPLLTTSSAIDYATGDYPNDYMYILSVYAEIEKALEDGSTITAAEKTPCEIINEFDSYKYIETPTNKPYFDKPKFIVNTEWGSNLITDVFTTAVENLYLYYVKAPDTITDWVAANDRNTTDYDQLPNHTHLNIASLAAMLMLENIESQRYQTNKELVNNEL